MLKYIEYIEMGHCDLQSINKEYSFKFAVFNGVLKTTDFL